MPETAGVQCALCDEPRCLTEDCWFLLVESRWQDRLKILKWDSTLALTPGFHSACCAAHAQLLVVHWMTTGSLTYPFAIANSSEKEKRGRVSTTMPLEV